MLEVAVERVKAEGLLLDYANIELEDLIRAAGVPRSTVFRIWPDRAAFVADLVRALFEADAGFDTGFDGPTLHALQQAIAAGADAPAHARQALLRDVLRGAVAHNIVAVESTVAWRAYRTMSAALSSGDAVPGGEGIRTLLSEIENRYLDRMAEMYRELNGAFGMRMRDGLTERDLAIAVMAMIDGMSDHRRIDPAMVDAPRTVVLGPEGPRDWHLAGIAVWGIYSAFTEDTSA
jgi:AcrR family transcriptional regulator